ncbi:MAG: sulfurtransferase [Deltaproteobacteria bacterium]|nr:sulfurtransferase [Deltaproteobacteria bacterium]MBW1718566.1 sulfurtransferase [Deltaproteobacteria bacterium]MBW1931726.1 sulfurtransferase [Deltaproteobacteria bacterium]MBW1937313.1 sulfurtransferase [Deltaproteobacteria bacterium]MBW1964383.1 sulfurtransferase [Deltaproteobacteria bacterium]
MSPEKLKQYIEKNKESDYLIVDVRQPKEYVRGHIPGAKLMPIKELVANLSDLPPGKDLIFYCHSGGRSEAAATLAAEEKIFNKDIYNLEGGIMAWDDRTVTDYPRVKVFDKSKSLSELLLIAMDLEKGAFRFYKHIKDRFASEPFSKTFEQLSKEEMGHAKAFYRYWKNNKSDSPEFETVFENLKGEILEGGENLIDILKRAEAIEGNTCLNLIELALNIENSSFDLYRTMAEQTDSKEAQDIFLSIAQAEKTHMRTLIDALDLCGHLGN